MLRRRRKHSASSSSPAAASAKKKDRSGRGSVHPKPTSASSAGRSGVGGGSSEPAPAPAPAETPPAAAKGAKRKGGARLWMRLGRAGRSEIVELDKGAIVARVGIPARDLRILGPVFSYSSNILARERAMVVNLEFIRAVVTAEEVLLLDPLSQEVLPFVDQLRQHFSMKNPVEAAEIERELPFEFQVLEIALDVVCSCLDAETAELEKAAYPVLDELTKKVSNKNLERVRCLKGDLTRLLARLQKVKDEIEHLLDDHEDMAHLYLTRKQIQNQQFEALTASGASNSIVAAGTDSAKHNPNFQSNASIITSIYVDHDVEDLDMLLEAYFMQLDGTRNKILLIREHIDDTEDYMNIQLDHRRNELIQLQLILAVISFGIALETYIASAFTMNLPCSFYHVYGLFWPFVVGSSGFSFLIFLALMGYAWWMELLSP
ncbi:putative magnesium transporter MRS2-G [Ananas comosus]|uniref:Magnesium transporter n=1 Tax=Ananas comosus TaxID=4615 RepID=A0A199V3V5_ANACO|nr:putative magnesium transporter MRS2-G [Ananas comosus]